MTLMLAYKIAIVAVFLFLVVSLFLTRNYARNKQIRIHRKWANVTTYNMIFLVLMIEVWIRFTVGFRSSTALLVHFAFVFPFFASILIMRFLITGAVDVVVHRMIAKSIPITLAGTAVTGAYLLWNL